MILKQAYKTPSLSSRSATIHLLFLLLIISFQVGTYIASFMFPANFELTGNNFFGFKVYLPAQIIFWQITYGFVSPIIIGYLATACCFFILYVLVKIKGSSILKAQDNLAAHAYGSARIESSSNPLFGLDAEQGVILGKTDKGNLAVFDSEHHVAVVGATGTGKSSSIYIPTLLYLNTACAVVTDLKNELWSKTAGWRSKFVGPVWKFNPWDETDCKNLLYFNPLLEIRVNDCDVVTDATSIARILGQPSTDSKSNSNNPHFTERAIKVLTSLIVYVMFAKTQDEKNLISVRALSAEGKSQLARKFYELSVKISNEEFPLVKAFLTEQSEKLANSESREFGSVQATLNKFLDVFDDGRVAQSMCKSSFPLSEFYSNEEYAQTIYITIPSDRQGEAAPLVRLLVEMLMNIILRQDEPKRLGRYNDQSKKHSKKGYPSWPRFSRTRVLFCLDEFAQLGQMPKMEQLLTLGRSFGVRVLLGLQTFNQIDRLYGKDNAIISNSQTWVITGLGNDLDTAKRISDMIGQASVAIITSSTSGDKMNPAKSQESINRQHQSRPLLRPEEILRMSEGQFLVLIAGLPPTTVDRAIVALDPMYKKVWKEAQKLDPNTIKGASKRKTWHSNNNKWKDINFSVKKEKVSSEPVGTDGNVSSDDSSTLLHVDEQNAKIITDNVNTPVDINFLENYSQESESKEYQNVKKTNYNLSSLEEKQRSRRLRAGARYNQHSNEDGTTEITYYNENEKKQPATRMPGQKKWMKNKSSNALKTAEVLKANNAKKQQPKKPAVAPQFTKENKSNSNADWMNTYR